jgi:hypothetical protein
MDYPIYLPHRKSTTRAAQTPMNTPMVNSSSLSASVGGGVNFSWPG